jgi:hypothetical protein
MRRIQSDELNESTSSLALIMPSTIDQVLLDQDEDQNDMQSNGIIAVLSRSFLNLRSFYKSKKYFQE